MSTDLNTGDMWHAFSESKQTPRFDKFAILVLGVAFSGCLNATGEMSLAEVNAAYRKATVFIRADKVNGQTGAVTTETGSGFILNNSGYVLTADHVVAAGSDIDVKIAGASESREAQLESLELLFENAQLDVALLKFKNTALPRKSVKVGNPWALDDGAKIYVLGFPGQEEWFSDAGTLSARSGPKGSWLTSMNLDAGTSGGPVFNQSGEVVAFVWGGANKLVSNGNAAAMHGLNRAIPVNLVGEFLSAAGVASPTTRMAFDEVTYKIDETLNSAMNVAPTTKAFEKVFAAKPGYVIVDQQLISKSATKVSDVSTSIAPDGKSMKVAYKLTSGPLYDQWRGWLEADVITKQVRSEAARP